MKLGIVLAGVLQSKIDFADLCAWAAANGYDATDTPVDRADGGDVARRAGLAVAATGGLPNLIVADPAARATAIAEAKARLDAAARAGHSLVMLGHARLAEGSDDDTMSALAAGFGPVADHAARLGIKLVMENYAAAGRNFASSPYNWRRIFQAVPSPAIGLCFDPSHLVFLGIDYQRALREFGDRIYYAHAKDTELIPEALYQHGFIANGFGRRPIGGDGWWRFTLPGYGAVDWGRYIGALREVGFDGILSVEHEDDAWGWRDDVPRTLQGLKMAEQYLRPFLD
jgi:sugar phosphate isomerase/epimerase